MPTTTNFGWTTPADTDLVKDGAAAMRTLGNGIDTSFLDLKGGTTGQNLRKATNTDLDFTWAGDATNTVIDAEGDLLVGDSADTLQRLAIGTNGQVLTVDTALDGKIKWASAAASAMTLISRTTFSNVASHIVDNCFTSTYKTYCIVIETVVASTQNDSFQMQWRTGGSSGSTRTTSYYGAYQRVETTPAVTNYGYNNVSEMTLYNRTNNNMVLWVQQAGNQNERATVFGMGINSNDIERIECHGTVAANLTVTGFLLKSSSTNITGAVAVYGLATV